MLNSQAVRVGFVTQLLWHRYGPFWRQLAEAAGAEVVFPTLEGTRAALGGAAVRSVPTAAFRLAAAQALSLAEEVDLLVVPRLNAESEVARGGGQDPWVVDFPTALQNTVPNLPTLRPVAAEVDAGVESEAVAFVQAMTREAAQVARVWSRVRALARPYKPAPVVWNYRPGELATVALIGQPWLLNDALTRAVTAPGEHVVSQHRLDPDELREEGHRADPHLIDTDAETLGAARSAARRSAVSRVRLLIDTGSGSDAWLARRIEKTIHKPVQAVSLQDALAGHDAVDTLSNLQLD